MWRLTNSGLTRIPMLSPRAIARSVAAGRLGGNRISVSSQKPECSNGGSWSFGTPS